MDIRLVPAYPGTPAIREIHVPIEHNGNLGTVGFNEVFEALETARRTMRSDRATDDDAWIAVHAGCICIGWPVSWSTSV